MAGFTSADFATLNKSTPNTGTSPQVLPQSVPDIETGVPDIPTGVEKPFTWARLGRDLSVGAGSWVATDLAVKGVGAGLTAFPATAPLGLAMMSPAGSFATKVISQAAKGLAATPLFEYITGKMDGKSDEQILHSLPSRILEDQIWMAGFAGTGKALSQAGKIFKSNTGMSWEKNIGTPLWDALGKVSSFQFIDKIMPESVVNSVFHNRTSLAEIFQPAVERLDPSLATKFRKTAVSESLSGHFARVMGQTMNDMTIEERFATFEFLKKGVTGITSTTKIPSSFRNLTQPAQDKVLSSLGEMTQWMTSTKERSSVIEILRTSEFQKQVGNLFKGGVQDRNSRFDPSYFKTLKTLFSGDIMDPKKVQQGLLDIMGHPNATAPAKSLAKDLYLLAETTVDNLPRAAQVAEMSTLMSKLRMQQGLISRVAKPGYVVSKNEEFKGLFIPKDVELGLSDMQYVAPLAKGIYNQFFLSPWKMGKVVMRIPTQVRNVVANIIQNDWGGLPAYRGDLYLRAAQEMKRETPLAQKFMRSIGTDVTFAGAEFTHFPRAISPGGSALEMGATYLTNLAGSVARPFAKSYQMAELWSKYTKYLHNLEIGMDHTTAVNDAVKWTFNYGEVTPLIKFARTSVAPFATWTSKVLPLMAETAVKHPVRFAKWAMIPAATTALALKNMDAPSNDEWTTLKSRLPDYMKSSMISLLPFRDANKRLMVYNYTWLLPGVGDITEMQDGWPEKAVLQNPFLSLAADIGRNKKFSGAPIWYDWEEPSVKVWRGLSHAYLQLLPSMMGDDIVSLNKTVNKEEGALTPGQQFSASVGFKPQPLESQKITRDWAGRLRHLHGEIRGRLVHELTNVTDPKDRQKIIDKYTAYMRKATLPNPE